MKFLESIAHALFVKARLKLNIKRLYAADGRAVQELLKVTDLLFAASQRANTDAEVRSLWVPSDCWCLMAMSEHGWWYLEMCQLAACEYRTSREGRNQLLKSWDIWIKPSSV